jgi:RNA polymerase sigma-70 factor (ECF subfamily)
LSPRDKQDALLVEKIRKDDKLAFSILFTRYYSDLVRFSSAMTCDKAAAEEIVQELFIRFWENRKDLSSIQSIKSYFLRSVQNRSIDWLRHESIKNSYLAMLMQHPAVIHNDTENYLLFSDLESKMQAALEKIPEEYAVVFRKSRLESLKYEEIAKSMGISVRSVEERISRAVRLLRLQLRDFIALF